MDTINPSVEKACPAVANATGAHHQAVRENNQTPGKAITTPSQSLSPLLPLWVGVNNGDSQENPLFSYWHTPIAIIF